MTAKSPNPPLPAELRSRVSQAAHRAVARFEADERLRLLTKLRDLVRTKATPAQLEAFVSGLERA